VSAVDVAESPHVFKVPNHHLAVDCLKRRRVSRTSRSTFRPESVASDLAEELESGEAPESFREAQGRAWRG
jgi:hypothetical protein